MTPDDQHGGNAPGQLILRDVDKFYGKDRVVNQVGVTIEAGEFFSLLGPSGSGKTTTLMMLAGFVHPDAGEILLDGNDIVSLPPQRRGFGMVFQNYAIFPHLNVYDNVAFPLRARRLPRPEIERRVRDALALVRLDKYADRFSRQLSGGQQQRVAIARAIVFNPSVVLMDEPLGALDKNLRYQMQVEIKEIQQRLGMTVVYVTHDQEEAMNMSDRIGIMNNGRIEQIGAPAQIYDDPCNAFVAEFLGEANLIGGSVIESGRDTASLCTPAGTLLHARCPAVALAPGSRGVVFVRPERVSLSTVETIGAPGLHEGINRVHGRVVQSAFLGNILRYTVDIEENLRIVVDVQNTFGAPPVSAGQSVWLAWRVQDSRLLGAPT